VIDADQVVPQEYTTYFRSVIIFGRARILNDEGEKRAALETLAAKYSPNEEQGRLQEIDKLFNQTCLVEIEIDHMTGKESIELVKKRARTE
jgi:nitroimidazol reductase NimA-like FMN-containing flavoprotein (pyridoxamine 5'-phosphate oxidase superfamily)